MKRGFSGLLLLFLVCSPVLMSVPTAAGLPSFTEFVAVHNPSINGEPTFYEQRVQLTAAVRPNFTKVSRSAYRAHFARLFKSEQTRYRTEAQRSATRVAQIDQFMKRGYKEMLGLPERIITPIITSFKNVLVDEYAPMVLAWNDAPLMRLNQYLLKYPVAPRKL